MKDIADLNLSPLPWNMTIDHRPDYSLFEVLADDGSVMASFDCCEDQWPNEVGYANAKLVKAAPALYKALVDLVKLHENCSEYDCDDCPMQDMAGKCDIIEDEYLDAAYRAIAEASGEEM